MLPEPKNYSVYPSVYPTDVESTVWVVPNEKAFLMFEGEEYTVRVIGNNEDVPDRADPRHHYVYRVKASGGVICFKHTFLKEQVNTVIVTYNEKDIVNQEVYSLREDLYALTPLRGDLHAHSYRSDGERDPAAFLGHVREQGYDFTTLSDHNRYYPGSEIDDTYKDVRLGITHIQGEEVHVPETPVHIVHVGGKSSVAEIYLDNSEEYQAEMAEYKANVPDSVPAQYSERYAIAKWVSDNAHKVGGLVIFAHPYWIPVNSKAFNVCDELAMIFLKSDIFDAFEVIGGISSNLNNRQVALWGEARAEGARIPVVGSSDVHGLKGDSYFPNNFTVCFANSREEVDILAAVKSGLSVAVEAQGEGYSRIYRAYGSLRLVSYARFLLENYFPMLQRVCQGEGVAMRYYAMGMTDKSTVECQVEQTEQFKNIFFGRIEPILPNEEIVEFEDRARERHLRSPKTKGSGLVSDKVTRQI